MSTATRYLQAIIDFQAEEIERLRQKVQDTEDLGYYKRGFEALKAAFERYAEND